MANKIQLRRDTATAWTAANPVLAQGEIGLDLTNRKIKIGDGATAWNTLTYWDDKETDLAGYATTQYVDDAIGAIVIPVDLANFGEGFSLDSDEKVVTNKLYSSDITQPTQRYRLELTTTGVVVLPDQSIINGATLKTIAGNYAGITAGPASPAGKDEDSWVWVDNDGATIATKYSTDNHQWKFGNDGTLTLPDSATLAVGSEAEIIALTLVYIDYRDQLGAAFAADNYTGDGYPASVDSYQQLSESVDPAIQPSWIALALSAFNAYEALFIAQQSVEFKINVYGREWRFTSDRTNITNSLSIPENTTITGLDNLELTVDGNGGKTAGIEFDAANNRVILKTTTKGWTFGNNGDLTLPTTGDIVTGDGESFLKDIPQNSPTGYTVNPYVLQASDRGRHILIDGSEGTSIQVPTDATEPMPIGSAIVLVIKPGMYNVFVGAEDYDAMVFHGAGVDSNGAFQIDAGNGGAMATLVKIGANEWMISGTGLAEYTGP
jgi:hypothetical protein